MGKKDTNQEPTANLNNVANRDIMQRINFLYQASTYLNSISPLAHVEVESKRKRKRRKKNAIRIPRNIAELSRCYVGSMRLVGQKTMVRMDPSIKRTLCKHCDTVLIPGSTVSVRVKPLGSHGHAVVYTCLACDSHNREAAPPVLDLDAQPAAQATHHPNVPSASATSSLLGAEGQNVMFVDSTPAQPSARRKRNPRKGPKRRLPPLFERKGHVVFRGNELLAV